MRAACRRLGQLLNQTELGRDVALPQPTVHRHLNLLETSYLLVRLPASSSTPGLPSNGCPPTSSPCRGGGSSEGEGWRGSSRSQLPGLQSGSRVR